MWVVKTRGESYYVNHVECNVPWSTKETPDSSHTKGSIKIKKCILRIDDENCAHIVEQNLHDLSRIRNQEKGINRVIFVWRDFSKFTEAVQNSNIKHGPIKTFRGGCEESYRVSEIYNEAQLTMLLLKMSGTSFRVLKPNEHYYRAYDDPSLDNDDDDLDE